ncbi:MAG: methyl-accepting chemotaxis protein, partial [Noviherbaspirillum sp.]
TTLVQQAGVTMEEIVASVKSVTELMSDISTASAEQDTGIDQVKQAIAQMDKTTQQNAALVGQAASTAESLADQAVRLSQTISMFKLSRNEVGGARALT